MSFRLVRPLHSFVVAAATLLASSTALSAQSASALIAKGDNAYAARDAAGALAQFQAVLAQDSNNVQALWKASAVSVALGEFAATDKQSTLYEQAERYARRAVALDSNNANTHFALAQALGRIALTVDPMARVKYAQEVYAQSTACLKLNPKHAECMHALGEWNAQVMRIDEFSRNMAINMLGAKVLEKASWKDAEHYMSGAVALQPARTIHHLDLGRIYADMHDAGKAKTQLIAAEKAPLVDYNDPNYKKAAAAALKTLGS